MRERAPVWRQGFSDNGLSEFSHWASYLVNSALTALRYTAAILLGVRHRSFISHSLIQADTDDFADVAEMGCEPPVVYRDVAIPAAEIKSKRL